MPQYKVEIKGLDKFRKALSQYPSIAKEYFARAIETMTWQLNRQAKRRSPVDTGRMRSSIYPTIRPDEGIVQPNVEYAIYVHEGTRYQKAQPFLLEALEDVQPDVESEFEQALENTLDEIARKS